MIYAIVGIGYLIDILFIIHDETKHDGLSIVLKTLASACFVTLSIILYGESSNQGLAIYIVLALVADLFGDFILILRNITDKHHDVIFVAGTICFFIGHIFLMIMLYINNPNVLLKSFIYTLVIFVVFCLYLLKKLNAKKAMRIMGGVYLFFIIYIQAYGLCSLVDVETSFDLAFLFGYFLFGVSDIVLIIQKFSNSKSNSLQPIYRLSYFISQVLIALSIAYL